MSTKICTKCGIEKDINDFCKHTCSKDGLSSDCRECTKQYRLSKKKETSEQAKIYYQKNKEQIKLHIKGYRESNPRIAKIYYEKNKEMLAKKYKQWSSKNKEHLSLKNRQWAMNNQDKIKRYYLDSKEKNAEHIKNYQKIHKEERQIYYKKYCQTHMEENRISCQRRRANRKLLLSTLTYTQWDTIKLNFNNRCCYCGEEKHLTQDHFVPLSKGGEYTHNNILPACQSCNSSKSIKDFFTWYPICEFYNKKRENKILKFLNYKNGIQQLMFM